MNVKCEWLVLVCLSLFSGSWLLGAEDEWVFWSPREEACPDHVERKDGGRTKTGSFVIESGLGEHWIGCWQRQFAVRGGGYYQFTAWRMHRGVKNVRRSVVARVLWKDVKGNALKWPEPAASGYNKGVAPVAEPEYPADHDSGEGQWGRFDDILEAPPGADFAVVELYLQWAGNARVEFCDVSLKAVDAPKPRRVKIAAVHLQPKEGRQPADKPPQFAQALAQAGKQGVDLVVLPETLTYYGTGKRMDECAETVPGPSTAYFGKLAREHSLHVVAGLIERDGKTLYNVAVLIGPDGELIGKYRKVCLPRGEITAGLTPGHDFPVFETQIGRIGMMVCYDGFFPEVARELSNRGAEIIAWPVWGCNPLLAAARACENHVYLVSSTYTEASQKWMISGIFDHFGDVLARAEEWGTLAIAEVDLNKPARWNSLGNFRAQIPSHRP
ncbi:MAG: carbon-nitrogen hydrolase family protein [Verrucomicrobiaceae bacterium]|nr:carbon-nitrogen hydrolase family protein [Verrucomicrobiaceae bacterium]